MNLNNDAIPILGEKKKICEFCGRHAHPFTTRCDYNDLKSRVKNLSDRAALIPHLTVQNKELAEIGLTFEQQFDRIAKTMLLVEKVVMEFENGPQIWTRFQERLEQEWPKISSPGTEEKQETSSQESTIQSETESKPCTVETTPGEIIVHDSSQSTLNVTHVVNAQLSLTT